MAPIFSLSQPLIKIYSDNGLRPTLLVRINPIRIGNPSFTTRLFESINRLCYNENTKKATNVKLELGSSQNGENEKDLTC